MSDTSELLHEQIQAAIMGDEGGLVTGWIISFEMVNSEGKPYSGYFCGPSTPPWKALGLLDWAERLIDLKHIQEQ